MSETNEPGTALATIESIALPVKFATEEVSDAIAKIRVAALSEAEGLDVSRPADREKMRSIAYRVARSKTAMEKLGKSLSDRRKAEIADEVNAIMVERKRIETDLDALRDQIKAPADRFDALAKSRIDGHEAAIEDIQHIAVKSDLGNASADDLRGLIAELDALPDRDWQEFRDRAEKLISTTREDLQFRLARRIQADADAAELARLQREEAARQQRERDATIARLAAEQAQREAEERAETARREEAERAERERLAAEEKARAEREAIEAAARRDREAAAEQVRLANEAAAQAELDRIAAVNQARVDAERAEADRVRRHESALASVNGMISDACSPMNVSEKIRYIVEVFDGMEEHKRDWQEFGERYAEAMAAGRKRIADRLAYVEQNEAERAEAARIENERRVEADRVAATERAAREQAAAIEAERERVAKIAADEERERKRREADRDHRGKVNASARDAIMDAIGEFTSTTASEANKIAEAVVKAIATGRVPGVTISY